MTYNPTPEGPTTHSHTTPTMWGHLKQVSWGAIFAGVAVALVVQVLLTLLGVGIGAATLDPGTADNPAASTFSVVSAIWYAISGIVAAFVGGLVASRMSGRTEEQIGGLHGLTAWAVTTLLMLYLLTSSVGAVVGGAFSGLSSAIGGVSQTVANAAGPALDDVNPLDALDQQIESTGNDPEALRQRAVNAMRGLAMSDEAGRDQARQEAAQALSDMSSIPLPEAREQVSQMEQQYRETVDQAQQTATEAAETAANAVSIGAIAAFVALLAGAIAAWMGGRRGVSHPTVIVQQDAPRRR